MPHSSVNFSGEKLIILKANDFKYITDNLRWAKTEPEKEIPTSSKQQASILVCPYLRACRALRAPFATHLETQQCLCLPKRANFLPSIHYSFKSVCV